ncbi:MAG: hypothetical protein LBP81_05600 [Treponema sp.]|nr:hypothetical protein [Treponema sp.]
MKRIRPLLCLLFFLLNGCAVFVPVEKNKAPPEAAADGPFEAAVDIPPAETPPVEILPAEWTVRDIKGLTARVEFSRGDTEDTAACGISFFNAIKDPKTAAAVLLVADGEFYPLEAFTAAIVKSETHELRINALISRKSLLTVLKAETICLIAVINKIEYQFEPAGDFTAYKNKVRKSLEAGNGLDDF